MSEAAWSIVGVVAGGLLATLSGVVTARVAAKHDRQAASTARRQDAYLEILGWFSRTRDELVRVTAEDAPWAGDYSERPERARMDALTHLYGSHAFRRTVSEWKPAFEYVVRTYEHLYNHRKRAAARNADDPSLAEDAAEVSEGLLELEEALRRIQEQARRDTDLR